MANMPHRLIDVSHDDPIARIFILFVQTARAVLKYSDADLSRKVRLSTIKLIVLRALASNNRAMTPSEIAEWTQTERHNITALIGRMRRDGLIAAERNSSDKRFVNVTLTDKGREALNRAMPVAKEIVDQVMSSIDEGDATLLEKRLQTLRQNAYDGLGNVAKHSQPRTRLEQWRCDLQIERKARMCNGESPTPFDIIGHSVTGILVKTSPLQGSFLISF